MTPNQRFQREIHEGEAWLRDVLDESAGPSAEELRLQAEIAVNEEWLRSKLRDNVPADLAHRIKTGILTERSGAGESRRPEAPTRQTRARHSRRIYRRVGGFGVIAATCAIVLTGLFQTKPVDVDLSLIAAFERFDEDAFSVEVELVLEDLSDLEPGAGEYAVWQNEDVFGGDLSDKMESVFSDEESYSDWS